MKICGIIAEYNPFHKGHLYQIDKIRQMGFTHIAVVMSGNAVQRGGFTVCDKFQRTLCALKGGADIVFELPCVYSLSPAKEFAFGAVSAFNAMKKVDSLCFGSESGDAKLLRDAARISEKFSLSEDIKKLLEEGLSYPEAMEMMFRQNGYSKEAKAAANPNDTLGIEYIKALNKLNSSIKPVALKRTSVEHNSLEASEGFASASAIRAMIENGADFSEYLPVGAEIENFSNASQIEAAVMYRLRTASLDDFADLPEVSQGLENRLYRAARSAVSTDEFISLVKTRRYTLAKIRRIIISLMIGITKSDLKIGIPYLRVLGMNERGKELLGYIGKECSLPIGTQLADLAKHSPSASRLAALEARLSDIYYLTTEKKLPCGTDYTNPPIII